MSNSLVIAGPLIGEWLALGSLPAGPAQVKWEGTYQLLSATNLAGPYLPIPEASSPFTTGCVDPERYFRLTLP